MIHEPRDTFDFSKFRLLPPKTASHGSFLAKCQYQDKPLYIQTPATRLKTKLNLNSKKTHYADFLFSNDNDEFIQWLERLEEESVNQLFENRTEWFETDLERVDIENSFTSPLKTFKSAQSFVVRAHIHTINPLGKPSLKIYDEHENEIDPETLTEKHQIVTILEIQGIKCSIRNFQIEIELKQVMVLETGEEYVKLFEKCLLVKTPSQVHAEILSESEPSKDLEVIPEPELTIKSEQQVPVNQKNFDEETEENEDLTPIDLEELDALSNLDTITVKNKKEIYYEMYREAKKRAKEARDLALSTYLEACKIKNTYCLDDLSDSDQDS